MDRGCYSPVILMQLIPTLATVLMEDLNAGCLWRRGPYPDMEAPNSI